MPTKTNSDIVVWYVSLTPPAEDLAVLVLEVVLDVPVVVEGVVAFELAPLTKLERLGSVVKTAFRSVTLAQSWFGVPVPATKFTAAHWNTSGLRARSHH